MKAQQSEKNLEFETRAEARAYKQLLQNSRSHISSDIIRIEVTDEGYHVTE